MRSSQSSTTSPAKMLPIVALLFCFTIAVKGSTTHDSHYIAAAVEYSPRVSSGLSPLENMMANVLALDQFMANASHQGADILLFPEVALVGYQNKAFYSRIPAPEQNAVPCQESEEHNRKPLNKLSCLAKKYKMYLAVNIPEEYPRELSCVNQNESCSSSDEVFHYNSNVVFDRKGTVIARYRKFHLFNEPEMDVPPAPELVTFDTDFGVTFGTFICFDILFKEPALDLIREKGIKDILYPSAWFSEVPFLTAVQTQASWAHRHDVNLIAAGINFPPVGSTGTGIYHGRQGPLAAFMNDQTESKMLVQRVPKYGHNLDSPVEDNSAGEDLDMDSLGLFPEVLENYTTVLIAQPDTGESINVDERVCNLGLCCNFKLKSTGSTFEKNDDLIENRSFYRLVVFNGVRDFQTFERSHSQVCGIVSCKDSSSTSCGWAPAHTKTHTRFDQINITGTFAASNLKDAVHYANTAVGSKFQVLPPSKYSLDIHDNPDDANMSDISLSLKQSVEYLRTFAIHGWVFEESK